MGTVQLSDLLTPYTAAALATTQLASLQSAGFPITNWASTGVFTVYVAAHSTAMVDIANTIGVIAAGGYLGLAAGKWLQLLASQNFLVDKKLATFTQRVLRFTDAGGAPVTIVAGQIWAVMSNGLRFTNITGGVIPVGGSLDITFQAETAGSAYNGASGSWTLQTAIAGITVADAPAGVTSAGTDDELDAALTARCVAKWGTLGAGANNDAYTYWATTTPGVTTVTRVGVAEATPLPGQVTLYVADGATTGTDGSAACDTPSVNAIQAYVDPPSHLGKSPNCVDVFVVAATRKLVTVAGTIYVQSSKLTTAQANAQNAINAYMAASPVGGYILDIANHRGVSFEVIHECFTGQTGVVDASFSSPVADVLLSSNQVPIVDISGVTWVGV